MMNKQTDKAVATTEVKTLVALPNITEKEVRKLNKLYKQHFLKTITNLDVLISGGFYTYNKKAGDALYDKKQKTVNSLIGSTFKKEYVGRSVEAINKFRGSTELPDPKNNLNYMQWLEGVYKQYPKDTKLPFVFFNTYDDETIYLTEVEYKEYRKNKRDMSVLRVLANTNRLGGLTANRTTQGMEFLFEEVQGKIIVKFTIMLEDKYYHKKIKNSIQSYISNIISQYQGVILNLAVYNGVTDYEVIFDKEYYTQLVTETLLGKKSFESILYSIFNSRLAETTEGVPKCAVRLRSYLVEDYQMEHQVTSYISNLQFDDEEELFSGYTLEDYKPNK